MESWIHELKNIKSFSSDNPKSDKIASALLELHFTCVTSAKEMLFSIFMALNP